MNRRIGYGHHVEAFEMRVLFSVAFGSGVSDAAHGAAAKGAAGGPPISLDLVALHEIGHALGLEHSSDTTSIMYPYYNEAYNLANFANDSAVATFRALYSSESTRPWKDALDADGGVTDGDVDLTYSFVRDGALMDEGAKSDTFAVLNKRFGARNWQGIFGQAVQRWAAVSNGTLQVRRFDADGIENAVYDYGAPGLAQNDPRMGDIRFATHKMDGASNVLAHTYYPPPDGGTAAGDSHYDSVENWVLSSGSLTSSSRTKTGLTSTELMGVSSGPSTFSAALISHDTEPLWGGRSDLL